MVSVLVADTEYLIQESLSCLEQVTVIEVGNGSVLRERIADIEPDVAVVNLANSNSGQSLLRELSEQFPQLKILAIAAADESALLKAVHSGATGGIVEGVRGEELKLVFGALVRSCTLISPQLKFVVLPERQQTLKVEKWSYWLAQELIGDWRHRSSPSSLSIDFLVRELGVVANQGVIPVVAYLEGSSRARSLFQELNRIVESLQAQYKEASFENLQRCETTLSNWFHSAVLEVGEHCCLNQIRQLNKEVRRVTLPKMRELISHWFHYGSNALFNRLNEALCALRPIGQNFENQRQTILERLSAADRAYLSLSQQLREEPNANRFEAAIEGLKFIYETKMHLEVGGATSTLVFDLVDEIQSQMEAIAATDRLLFDLEKKFSDGCALDPKYVLLLHDYWRDLVDARALRQDFESWLGLALPYWGTASIEQQALLERVLDQLRPVAFNIYLQCCREALLLKKIPAPIVPTT